MVSIWSYPSIWRARVNSMHGKRFVGWFDKMRGGGKARGIAVAAQGSGEEGGAQK